MRDRSQRLSIDLATALRSLVFLILVPGVVAVWAPLRLARGADRLFSETWGVAAWPLWIVGALGIVWSFWEFLSRGRGTPAPFDAPRELVVSGPYRHVRNPMYFSAMLMLAGHFLYFGAWVLLVYMAAVFAAVYAFVLVYEEPTLERRFGAAYETYCRNVPRWMPRLIPWQPSNLGKNGGVE